MFRGASSLNLDAKGRLGIPARFRDVLVERCDGRMVLTINTAALQTTKNLGLNTPQRCLWLYPHDEWDTVERKVAELPSFDPTAQELKRFLIGYATDCELDSAGRVRVSAPLREFAGLEKRVVLIGQRNKFEIWDESLWNTRCEEWLQMEPKDRQLPIELETITL